MIGNFVPHKLLAEPALDPSYECAAYYLGGLMNGLGGG